MVGNFCQQLSLSLRCGVIYLFCLVCHLSVSCNAYIVDKRYDLPENCDCRTATEWYKVGPLTTLYSPKLECWLTPNTFIANCAQTTTLQNWPLIHICTVPIFTPMTLFTVHTHGPYAVNKCYLPCADHTRVPTMCKQRVAWVLVCSCCCYVNYEQRN